MRYIKPTIGILLIILALLGGYYWETQGRQSYQQIEVPVTSVDILKGERLGHQMVKTVYLDKGALVGGTLMEKDIHQLVDSRATQFIPANSQIVREYFESSNTSFTKNRSVFSLPSSWIFSKSSSLRKGDWVEIYGEDISYFGRYQIAFVKDQGDVEIENPEGPYIEKNILERTVSTGFIHHVELYCTLEDYSCLLDYVKTTGMGLLLVQREEAD
ncbi:MAG: SAF domain-containing protein [Anaerovoracaceae bacterium]|jgi:hypothetical protein|nr:SAF domain-containing protein [Anaerovoracaceae bacterium]